MHRKKVHDFGKDVKYPIVETRHAVDSVAAKPAETRYVNIHFAAVRYPDRTISVLEPGYLGVCKNRIRSTVLESAKQKSCSVAVNAGYFVLDGSCIDNNNSRNMTILSC